MNNRNLQLLGQIYGFLKVISQEPTIKYQRRWKCECVCGKERVLTTAMLISGGCTSCGCKNFTSEHKNKRYSEQDASYRARVTTIKSAAKNRDIAWDLPIEYGVSLITKNCTYCGSEPSIHFNVMESKRSKSSILQKDVSKYDVVTNGIDRVNSKFGYEVNNVVTSCWICNCAKSTYDTIDFKQWIVSLHEHNVSMDKLLNPVLYDETEDLINTSKIYKKYTSLDASYSAKVSMLKSGAKHRGIDWALDKNNALTLIKSNCVYCGIAPSMDFNIMSDKRINKMSAYRDKNHYAVKVNSIDRIDSNIGYTDSNVVPCCKICNTAKNNLNVIDFIAWIKKITTNTRCL